MLFAHVLILDVHLLRSWICSCVWNLGQVTTLDGHKLFSLFIVAQLVRKRPAFC